MVNFSLAFVFILLSRAGRRFSPGSGAVNLSFDVSGMNGARGFSGGLIFAFIRESGNMERSGLGFSSIF